MDSFNKDGFSVHSKVFSIKDMCQSLGVINYGCHKISLLQKLEEKI